MAKATGKYPTRGGSEKSYNSEREENTKLFLQRINFSADSHADKLRANLAFREIQRTRTSSLRGKASSRIKKGTRKHPESDGRV